jgi:hypothetical protein
MSDRPVSLLATLGPGFAQLVTPKDRANGGEWMPVRGNPQARVKLSYLESDVVQRALFEAAKKRQRVAAFKKDVTWDDARGHVLDKLAHAVRAWEGFGDLACTYDNARAVLEEFDVLRDDAAVFAGDRANYGLSDPDAMAALEGNSAPVSATASAET